MAILMGTFLDPYEPSITIMIFMGALPLFILDKPWRVCLYITIVAACCYQAKEFGLFIEDFIDLVAFFTLAIGVNSFTLHDRLENVVNYVKFREKSERDALTGIYNRGKGEEKIAQLLQKETYGAFCIIDVDDFKYFNDTFGHSCGDEILQEIAKIIQNCFSSNDVFFRMGGDEFIIYCVDYIDGSQWEDRLDHFYKEIEAIHISTINHKHISISLGCCIYSKGLADYNKLYLCSDQALYKSKSMSKGRYTISHLQC